MDNRLLRFMPADAVASRTVRPEMSLQKLVLFIVECYQKKVDTDRQCMMVNQPRSRLPEFVVNIGQSIANAATRAATAAAAAFSSFSWPANPPPPNNTTDATPPDAFST